MLKFAKRPKTPGITLKKHGFFEGNQLFASDYHALRDEINAGTLNLQRNGTGNGLSNNEDAFAESLQLQTPVVHQSMCIFKAGLSSLSDGWAKHKQKVPDM